MQTGMGTVRLVVDPEGSNEAVLDQAAAILRTGGTVALPTETVYGLGANALDEVAVARIFQAKGRPGWDPLIVHVCDEAMLNLVASEIAGAARKLMEAFWPGPLTVLLPRSELVPNPVTAGRPLVGVRMPAHPVALELIRRAAVPIAAPSANRFGHTSPTTAQHVLDDLDGRIDAVVDAGPCGYGVESTVVDATVWPLIIYRPGAVTIEQIREFAGEAEFFVTGARAADLALEDEVRQGLPSPGVGVRHYAPRARLMLVEGAGDEAAVQRALAREARIQGGIWGAERVGVLWPGELAEASRDLADVQVFRWGRWADGEELARRVFAGLRALDHQGCSVILCPRPSGEGIGAAILDRLLKAAYR